MNPMWRSRIIRAVAIITVLGVAGIAAVVSFSHMRALGLRLGESWRAQLIPFSVDGLVVAASLVLVDRRLRGLAMSLRECWLPWGAIGAGVLTSLIANAADATSGEAQLWSAWPALAFGVAFELLLILFRGQDSGHTAESAEPKLTSPPVPALDLPPARYQPIASPVVVPPKPVPTPPPVAPDRSTQPRVPEASSTQPVPPQVRPTVPSTPPTPPATAPAPQPRRPDPAPRPTLVAVEPPRAPAPRPVPAAAKPTNGPTQRQIEQVRKAYRASGGTIGRRALAKLPGLTEHLARLALERVKAEETSTSNSGEGGKPQQASGGSR